MPMHCRCIQCKSKYIKNVTFHWTKLQALLAWRNGWQTNPQSHWSRCVQHCLWNLSPAFQQKKEQSYIFLFHFQVNMRFCALQRSLRAYLSGSWFSRYVANEKQYSLQSSQYLTAYWQHFTWNYKSLYRSCLTGVQSSHASQTNIGRKGAADRTKINAALLTNQCPHSHPWLYE